MLQAEQIDQAAAHLVRARRAGAPGPCMPESYRPQDTDSALAIQKRVFDLLGERAGGWKCGVPSAQAGVIAAPIPASAIHRSSPCPVVGTKGFIEPEIAFVLGRDLPARGTPYSEDEIRGAIGEIRMVIELIGTRYEKNAEATAPEILADSFKNAGLFIGPPLPGALERPLEVLHARITGPEGTLFDQNRPHPSGHPLKSLFWLVRFLNDRGEGLQEGQVVTTGSYAGVVEAPLNTRLRVELGDFAVLDLELITDKP